MYMGCNRSTFFYLEIKINVFDRIHSIISQRKVKLNTGRQDKSGDIKLLKELLKLHASCRRAAESLNSAKASIGQSID